MCTQRILHVILSQIIEHFELRTSRNCWHLHQTQFVLLWTNLQVKKLHNAYDDCTTWLCGTLHTLHFMSEKEHCQDTKLPCTYTQKFDRRQKRKLMHIILDDSFVSRNLPYFLSLAVQLGRGPGNELCYNMLMICVSVLLKANEALL